MSPRRRVNEEEAAAASLNGGRNLQYVATLLEQNHFSQIAKRLPETDSSL